METKLRRRRSFDKEFKRQAIRLVVEDGHSCRSVERDLGISEGAVYKWVRASKADPEHCFPGKGHLKPGVADVSKLTREISMLRRERDILKKALAIFSTQRTRNTVL
jgi:transposase